MIRIFVKGHKFEYDDNDKNIIAIPCLNCKICYRYLNNFLNIAGPMHPAYDREYFMAAHSLFDNEAFRYYNMYDIIFCNEIKFRCLL